MLLARETRSAFDRLPAAGQWAGRLMRKGWRLLMVDLPGKRRPKWVLVYGDPARTGCQTKHVDPRTARKLVGVLGLVPITVDRYHAVYSLGE